MSGGMKLSETSIFPLGYLSDQVAWYAANIIGAFLAAVAVRFVQKKWLFVSILTPHVLNILITN